MTTYARIDPLSALVRDTVNLTQAQFDALNGNPKQAFLKPLVIDARPVPSTSQVVIDAGYVIEAAQVRQTWSVRAKTQGELDNDVALAERVVLETALAVFDARTATPAQVQRAIAWLIRKQQ